MTTNKFNKGDIVYSVDVNEYLIVSINKLIVESFFFNHLPEYNKFIYSCQGNLEHTIIRDYELPLTQEEIEEQNSPFKSSFRDKRNPGVTSSCSSVEEYLYTKEELNDAIEYKVQKMREQNANLAEEAEKFRCPITGGKMKRKEERGHYTLDGPSYYKVENSNIVWEKWPRSEGVYETKVDGVTHEYKYLENGQWEKVSAEITREEKKEILETFKWIKVKHYKDDETLSWEERYKKLEEHHIEETNFLINKLRDIVKAL